VIKCIKFKPYTKNTLRGFADLELDSGIIIHDLTLHEKDGKRWVGMPARSFTGNDGATKWTPIVEVAEHARASFQRQALAAIHVVAGEVQSTNAEQPADHTSIPF
jgi:DNA-binding cell septation regulator SpoVG